jgi:hypothetical protein
LVNEVGVSEKPPDDRQPPPLGYYTPRDHPHDGVTPGGAYALGCLTNILGLLICLFVAYLGQGAPVGFIIGLVLGLIPIVIFAVRSTRRTAFILGAASPLIVVFLLLGLCFALLNKP